MKHTLSNSSNLDYQLIEQAIRYIRVNALTQPTLDEVAEAVNISSSHCQRLFKCYAGISPKRFLQYLTVNHAKTLLINSMSVMEASLESGLSGPSRLHDHFVALEAVTPGDFVRKGEGLNFRYGFHLSDLGTIFLVQSTRGICRLAFTEVGEEQKALDGFCREWPQAECEEDQAATKLTLDNLFAGNSKNPTRLLVQGTNFQIKVWEALLSIPPGAATSYGKLSEQLGCPKASRAVANAVGANPIAMLIPCHRVLRKNGALGGYRWGLSRKQLLLACETAAREIQN